MSKKILIACEESQIVTKAFRSLGIEAYSCDLLPTSGSNPEWHLLQDVTPLLEKKWDGIIAFPPCTDLAISGARWFEEKRKNGSQQKSINFFMQFTTTNSPFVAIENPIGIMSTIYRQPDQIIQPWQFGDPFQKSTCLWLKGFPLLIPNDIVHKGEFIEVVDKKTGRIKKIPKWYSNLTKKDRAKMRNKTFEGIANAMANQWGKLFL
jgi:hypothetical protein